MQDQQQQERADNGEDTDTGTRDQAGETPEPHEPVAETPDVDVDAYAAKRTWRFARSGYQRDLEVENVEMTWDEIVDFAKHASFDDRTKSFQTDPARRGCHKDGPGIIPCQMKKGEGRTRATEDQEGYFRQGHLVLACSFACLDIEDWSIGADDEDGVKEWIREWHGPRLAAWTTFNHGNSQKWVEGEPRLRVLIPLARPVDPSKYEYLEQLLSACLSKSAHIDQSSQCADLQAMKPNSFFGTWRRLPGGEGRRVKPWFLTMEGEILDPDAIPIPPEVAKELGVDDSVCTLDDWVDVRAAEDRVEDSTEVSHVRDISDGAVAEILEVLRHADHPEKGAYVDERTLWLKVGMALHDHYEGSDEGLAVWDEWSRASAKWEDGTCEKNWGSFGSQTGGVTVGTLWYWASEFHEWDPPKGTVSGTLFRVGDQTELARRIIDEHMREQIPETVVDEWGNTLALNWDPEGDGTITVVRDRGAVWHWNPETGLYDEFNEDDAKRLAMTYSGHPVLGSRGTNPLRINDSTGAGVYGLIKAMPQGELGKGFFDDAGSGVAFKNCCLIAGKTKNDPVPRVVRFEGVPHTKFKIRHRLDIEYDPDAKCPVFLDMLRTSWKGDEDVDDKINLLQEMFAAAIFGSATDLQRAMMMQGPGGSGKSVVMDILSAIFPDDALASVSPHDMESDQYGTAPLANARLNVVSDIDAATLMHTGRFKQAVVGDRINIRNMREIAVSMRVHAAHIFSCNKLPTVRDDTDGFWRRWVMLEFARKVEGTEDEDPYITEKILEGELPGVVAWAVRGHERLMRQGGYTEPPSSRRLLLEWRSDSNPVASFAMERIREAGADGSCAITDPQSDGTGAQVVYDAYSSWCDRSGYRPLNKGNFKTALENLGYGRKRKSSGFHWLFDLQQMYARSTPGVSFQNFDD